MKFGQISEARVYSFVNTRIKARKGQLLNIADYERLLSSTLLEGLNYLPTTHSRYRDLFTGLDLNSKVFCPNSEKVLKESVYSEIFALVQDLPEKVRDLIEFYVKKSYIGTLKSVLRRLQAKDPEPLSVEDLFTATLEERMELIIISKAETFDTLIEKLQTPWIINALTSAMSAYQEKRNILLLENALDQSYYKQLWDVIIPSQHKRDRKVAQKIIGMEIDLTNITIILRSKLLNFPPEEIMTQLIPINYRLGSCLSNAVKAYTFLDSIKSLQAAVYSDLVQAIYRVYSEKEGSIANMEQLRQEWFIQALFAILAGYPFHIGIFLSYIILRFQEIENLRIIFETKWKGVDLELARELLIYFR